MKIFYRCMHFITKTFFRIFYRHQVYGLEHIAGGKAILAANHASYLDPPLIGVSWPEEIAFLARKSLFAHPLFGSAIRNLNAYPITGTAQDLNSIKQICTLLENDKKVVIFPEGIRTSNGHLGMIKSGIGMLAMRCHAPIIPIYIYGSFEVWNRKKRLPKLFGKTACIIGSAIDWQQFAGLEKKAAQEALATEVKQAIEALKKWYENGAVGSPP